MHYVNLLLQPSYQAIRVEAKGLEPSNLLTASQALYQLSYAPERREHSIRPRLEAASGELSRLAPRQQRAAAISPVLVQKPGRRAGG